MVKPSSGYRFGHRFRVGPYRCCSDGNPMTLSILLWSYLILSATHITFWSFCVASIALRCHGCLKTGQDPLENSRLQVSFKSFKHGTSLQYVCYGMLVQSKNLMTLMTFNLQITLKSTKSSSFAFHCFNCSSTSQPTCPTTNQGKHPKVEEANESKSQNIYGYLWCFPLVSRFFFH